MHFNGFNASSACVSYIMEHADDVSKMFGWNCVTLLAMFDTYVVNNCIRNRVLTYGNTWVRRSFMTCPASWWDSRFDWSNAQRQDIAAERTAAAVLKMRRNTLKDDRRRALLNVLARRFGTSDVSWAVCMHLVRKVWIFSQDNGEGTKPEPVSSTQCVSMCVSYRPSSLFWKQHQRGQRNQQFDSLSLKMEAWWWSIWTSGLH